MVLVGLASLAIERANAARLLRLGARLLSSASRSSLRMHQIGIRLFLCWFRCVVVWGTSVAGRCLA